MKRLLLAFAAVALLAGCGGGGGGGSTSPAIPNPPAPSPSTGGGGGTGGGGTGGGGGGSTATPTPTPTPTPTTSSSPGATNPSGTVITIGTAGTLSQNAINPLPANATQVTSSKVAVVTATHNGTAVAAGTTLISTITSSDKSGNTCLVYVPNGSNSGTPCTYPAPGSTPAPVTIKAAGDGVQVQYNDGPMAPGGSFFLAGTNPGTGNSAPAIVTLLNPTVSVGHNSGGSAAPQGGGIVYANNDIYITQNSASQPIGVTSYSNGTAGATMTALSASPALTGAPAGGLVMGPDNNLWGTEQNATTAFEINPTTGATKEYTISCPSGSAGATGTSYALGPQTGIVSGGGNVYVLCADVAAKDQTHNNVNTINPSTGTVTTCNLSSNGGSSGGSFSNGAVYSNGTIYTAIGTGSGNQAGGANQGLWIQFQPGTCGSFTAISTSGGAPIYGNGSLVMLSDGNLYSESDQLRATTSFGSATSASPVWDGVNTNIADSGGGGLAQDTVLGSKWFFGTASGHDLNIHTAWTGGNDDTENPTNMQPLSNGGTKPNPGECGVALNQGGGNGLIQLPDGKLAWPHSTNGLSPGSYICFANL